MAPKQSRRRCFLSCFLLIIPAWYILYSGHIHTELHESVSADGKQLEPRGAIELSAPPQRETHHEKGQTDAVRALIIPAVSVSTSPTKAIQNIPEAPAMYDVPVEQILLKRKSESDDPLHRPIYKKQKPGGSTTGSSDIPDDVKWCRDAKAKYSVSPGTSWGTLRGGPRVEWGKRGCDIVIATGRVFDCEDSWGERYLQAWKETQTVSCPQQGEFNQAAYKSTVTCRSHPATSSKACMFENVIIDFSKAPVAGNARSFANGFVRAACRGGDGDIPLPPGLVLSHGTLSDAECDMVETIPSFFMSHDLIFNLGHTISDFWIVFTTMQALELDWTQFRLVNMDAIRGNGPAGRGNKITLAGDPDHISSFFETYDKWFGQGLKRPINYAGKKVCFRKAVFQAKPGPAHIWTSLASGTNQTTERCSSSSNGSWLLRKYNRFNREKWGLITKSTTARLQNTGPSITLIVRKGDNMRVFANENEVISALRDIPGAGDFRAVDFSSIPYSEQIKLAHNTSLLIGMHGAALFHLLSMDVDSMSCCGVIELYHKRWSQNEAVPTVMNMARFLGFDYRVLRSSESENVKQIRHRGTGTMVDSTSLRSLATEAVKHLIHKRMLFDRKHGHVQGAAP